MWRFEAAHFTEMMTMPGQGGCPNCQSGDIHNSAQNLKSSMTTLNLYNKFRNSFRGNQNEYFFNEKHRMSLSSECGNSYLFSPHASMEKSSSFRLLNLSNKSDRKSSPPIETSKSANLSPVHQLNSMFRKSLPRVSVTNIDEPLLNKKKDKSNPKTKDRIELRRQSSSKVEKVSRFKRGFGKPGDIRRRTLRNIEQAKYRVWAANAAHDMVVKRTTPKPDNSSLLKRRFTNAIPDVLSGKRTGPDGNNEDDQEYSISGAVAQTAVLTAAPSSSDYVKSKGDTSGEEEEQEQKPLSLHHLSPAKYPLNLTESPSKRPQSPRSPTADKKLYSVPEENLVVGEPSVAGKRLTPPSILPHGKMSTLGSSMESTDSNCTGQCDSPTAQRETKVTLSSPVFNDLSHSDSSVSLETHNKLCTDPQQNTTSVEGKTKQSDTEPDSTVLWNVPGQGLTDLVTSRL